uniref:Uncharacterized protein n=1 Tax=Oryza barthii TaxID=65489 RepID=A0A0D3HUY8_9ORYZ
MTTFLASIHQQAGSRREINMWQQTRLKTDLKDLQRVFGLLDGIPELPHHLGQTWIAQRLLLINSVKDRFNKGQLLLQPLAQIPVGNAIDNLFDEVGDGRLHHGLPDEDSCSFRHATKRFGWKRMRIKQSSLEVNAPSVMRWFGTRKIPNTNSSAM